MAYAQDGIVENTDVNDTLLNPADAAKRLNAIWGVGKGNRGYGQSPLLNTVEKGEVVYAYVWNNIVLRTQQVARHVGKTMTFVGINAGNTILYNQGLTQKQIEEVDDARTSALIQDWGIYHYGVNNYTWQNQLKYTITCTFAAPDQARYFWNCGGQLLLTLSQPEVPGKPVTKLFNKLASDMGTLYWGTTPGAGKKTVIYGNEFDAVTRISGAGTPVILAKDTDYYATSLYNSVEGVTLFEQKVENSIPAYSNSFLKVLASTSGTKGINGDNGTTIILQVILDEVPDTAVMPAGGQVTLGVLPPAPPTRTQSYLTSTSWGIPSVRITSTAI